MEVKNLVIRTDLFPKVWLQHNLMMAMDILFDGKFRGEEKVQFYSISVIYEFSDD